MTDGDGSSLTGTGKILQVVSTEESTWTTASGYTPVSMNLGVTITPTSTSNRLLFLVDLNGLYAPSTSQSIELEVHKDSTLVKFIDGHGTSNMAAYAANCSYNFLVDVTSTSSQTWDIMGTTTSGGTWGWCNYSSGGNERTLCTLTILEIAQ